MKPFDHAAINAVLLCFVLCNVLYPLCNCSIVYTANYTGSHILVSIKFCSSEVYNAGPLVSFLSCKPFTFVPSVHVMLILYVENLKPMVCQMSVMRSMRKTISPEHSIFLYCTQNDFIFSLQHFDNG